MPSAAIDRCAPGLLAVLALTGAPRAGAQNGAAAGELARAVGDGGFDLTLTYRYENVEQAGFALDANASVLRTRLTYTSADFHAATLTLEVDDVRAIGADRYNSTRNGRTDRPVVADPEGTEINELVLAYEGESRTRFTFGRQRLSFSSRRFLGSINWRLNEQTFDALAVTGEPARGLTAGYAFIANANRIFGPDDGVPLADLGGRMHLFDAKYALGAGTQLWGYAYLFDFDEAPELSSATAGLRLAGSRALNERIAVPYAIEYARQRDYADNPVGYTADYIVLQAGLAVGAVEITAGVEVLGGGGRPGSAMTTPLAGLHGYNGWADQFLAIPDDGLEDYSLELSAPLGRGRLDAALHDFGASRGSSSYGDELDVSLGWSFAERYTLIVKAADYHADAHAADTRKLWVMLSATF